MAGEGRALERGDDFSTIGAGGAFYRIGQQQDARGRWFRYLSVAN